MSRGILEKVVADQLDAILREQQLFGGPPLAAVPELRMIAEMPASLRWKHPVNLEALGDGYSFVQVCPTLEYQALWTHVENNRYRSSFRQFLDRLYPSASGLALTRDYNIDHLYNRERAREFGHKYVRMVLVPEPINKSHGAGYKKGRTAAGIGMVGQVRHVDTVMMMKLFGYRSPPLSGLVTPDVQAFAEKFAPMVDATPAQIVQEIVNLMEVARRRQG